MNYDCWIVEIYLVHIVTVVVENEIDIGRQTAEFYGCPIVCTTSCHGIKIPTQ